MKIKKDDNVIIISGKDKGFKGKIVQIDNKKDRVVVDGANLIKKHIKSSKKGEKGQRVEIPAPLHISNVQLYCDNCKKGVKVSFAKQEDGSKKRICKKCNHEI
ncbi:MAG: 50S ribosomal protein L24 [Patescibacteria group bacterium]|nr:50S ribosomal protein L24 [Patescibacteria group bacterium]